MDTEKLLTRIKSAFDSYGKRSGIAPNVSSFTLQNFTEAVMGLITHPEEANLKELEQDLVSAIGLDPNAPYSLGNKTYYYDRECNSGHKDLKDDEIAFASEWYDGYQWVVPVCKRCIEIEVAKGEYGSNPRLYSYATSFHLKQHK